jgi:phage-related protein
MPLTFPNHPVHYGSKPKTEMKVLEADFGDGYTQRVADGLNSIKETWTVDWKNIEKVDAFEIVNFLKARKGFEAFYWTPPGELSARLWTCKTFDGPTPTEGNYLYNVGATFREEFDI